MADQSRGACQHGCSSSQGHSNTPQPWGCHWIYVGPLHGSHEQRGLSVAGMVVHAASDSTGRVLSLPMRPAVSKCHMALCGNSWHRCGIPDQPAVASFMQSLSAHACQQGPRGAESFMQTLSAHASASRCVSAGATWRSEFHPGSVSPCVCQPMRPSVSKGHMALCGSSRRRRGIPLQPAAVSFMQDPVVACSRKSPWQSAATQQVCQAVLHGSGRHTVPQGGPLVSQQRQTGGPLLR